MDIEMSECHRVVSNTDWLKARVDLLAKEKEFTKLRDELSQARRDLPWERVSENYVLQGREQRSVPHLFLLCARR